VRWRRSPQVLWRTAPGYLVLGTVDGRTLEVEGSGGEVWARLDRWIAEDQLTTELARYFGVDLGLVAAEVGSLLEELHVRGYVDRDG
jgi:hypothetical protein